MVEGGATVDVISANTCHFARVRIISINTTIITQQEKYLAQHLWVAV